MCTCKYSHEKNISNTHKYMHAKNKHMQNTDVKTYTHIYTRTNKQTDERASTHATQVLTLSSLLTFPSLINENNDPLASFLS